MSADLEHRDGEAVIVTPVSTILTQIQSEQAAGFARIETSLAGKADKGDMIELRTTVREHADRISSLESDRRVRADEGKRLFTRRQAFWTIILGIGVITATITGPIIATAVH